MRRTFRLRPLTVAIRRGLGLDPRCGTTPKVVRRG